MTIDKTVVFYSLILLIGVFISAISQVMLKKAAVRNYDSHLKEYMNPLVVFAYVLFFGTTILSVLAYKGIPLSMGPVLESTSYIYITVFGVKIFKEKMNLKKYVALSLIVTGIFIYSVFG